MRSRIELNGDKKLIIKANQSRALNILLSCFLCVLMFLAFYAYRNVLLYAELNKFVVIVVSLFMILFIGFPFAFLAWNTCGEVLIKKDERFIYIKRPLLRSARFIREKIQKVGPVLKNPIMKSVDENSDYVFLGMGLWQVNFDYNKQTLGVGYGLTRGDAKTVADFIAK